MARLMEERCDYLLLPRPWLEIRLPRVSGGPTRNAGLYVRGETIVGGCVIRLPYWHKVVNLKNKA